jgi:acyl-coenzyme A thioesterase PaaI-like protein
VFPTIPQMLTLTMNVEFRSALVKTDAVAEGWITQRGNSIVFCEAEVRAADDARVVANGRVVSKVRPASTT